MENIEFNAATYAADLRLAGNAWRNADGKADNFARSAIAAILTDARSPLSVALFVYDEMKPETAKGKAAEPKESDKAPCGVSVSSLRSAKGGEGARSALEAIFYVAENAEHDKAAVAAFIRNDKGALRLFPLKAALAKAKAAAAKAENEGEGEGADLAEREGDDVAVPSIVGEIEAMTAKLAALGGEDLAAAGDAIAALMAAARDAAERMAAAEQLESAAA